MTKHRSRSTAQEATEQLGIAPLPRPNITSPWFPNLMPAPGLSAPFVASLKKLRRLRKRDKASLAADRTDYANHY
ncbi:hypothetical protein GFM09_34555 [Rhizobium leguminosarum bv. viciae]|uniref:hypothetical protein n=1 Tax=Rhizobium leguminosarum TaxID=384 RepID=UPI0014429103|nr:hypothetical protein [Rhizobium leguminosarum]NKL74264.1 hypothetical protein [Rhizobium leguminosarum bv. viciae]